MSKKFVAKTVSGATLIAIGLAVFQQGLTLFNEDQTTGIILMVLGVSIIALGLGLTIYKPEAPITKKKRKK